MHVFYFQLPTCFFAEETQAERREQVCYDYPYHVIMSMLFLSGGLLFFFAIISSSSIINTFIHHLLIMSILSLKYLSP